MEHRNENTGLEREILVCGRWRHHTQNEKFSFAVRNVLTVLLATDHSRNEEVNEEVKARIGNNIEPYEDLQTLVKRHKLKWHGHVTWSSGLAKTILQGTVQGGRPLKRQTEEMMGRQHQKVDWPWMKYTTTVGGRNSSVGSAWARCPQCRGFDPPLGTFSVEGIFPLELTWVQTPFPQKLLRMRA